MLAARKPSRLVTTPRPVVAPPALPAWLGSVQQLLARLPVDDGQLAIRLHQVADKAGISLDEVSYQRQLEKNLPVWRTEASFTLTDGYPQIRRFLDLMVAGQTNLALEALDCTRDDISNPEVTCVIRLAAYGKDNTGASHVR